MMKWWRVWGLLFLLTMVGLYVSVFLMQREIVSAWVTLFVVCAGFGAMGWYVDRRIMRPVQRLTKTIERIHSGDLNARILPRSNDEIGTLLRAFNQLNRKQINKIAELRTQQELSLTVFGQMSDGAIVTDRAGTVQVVNQAAADLFEVSTADAVGHSFGAMVQHHEIIDLWHQAIEKNEVQSSIVDVRNWGMFLQINIIPVKEGVLDGYIVIISDLTRVQRLETIRRDFISNISHELKTPLTGIATIIETLRDGALKEPKVAKKFLKRASKEVDTMTQMVSELLELARIESGRVPLRFAPAPLLPIVEAAVEHLAKPIDRKQLKLTFGIPDNLPPLLIDEERIERVIINLLHNATKFTEEEGGISIVAEVVDVEGRPFVRMSIIDDGIGIPADDLPRVFERFYKIDRARNSSGTGLGLAIVKHTIQAHGGEVGVDSREAEGSTFYFTLPIAEQDSNREER